MQGTRTTSFLASYNGNEQRQDVRDPTSTIDCRDRFRLVTIEGTQYEIADIGMRMLTPRELYRAQRFPDSYRIDVTHKGKALSKGAQIPHVRQQRLPADRRGAR